MENLDYLQPSPMMGDMQMQWGVEDQQQMMFGSNPMLMSQQYHAADIQQGRMMIPVSSPSCSEIATSAPPSGNIHPWSNMPPQFYNAFMASSDVEKEEARRLVHNFFLLIFPTGADFLPCGEIS